ncbi:MAG: methyltransferase domain-containing protein [Planctomycetes bacterium]|nr:methyltransferase domain-containing protein [Planctomycetota bacterium]
MKGRNERFHDRYARVYDAVYEKSAYWRFYRDLTWHNVKRFLPRDAGAEIADLGCGTGEWGLRCMASGYRVTFVDLSNEMLCRARERVDEEYPGRESLFIKSDICELKDLPSDRFGLALAQGDPLSFTEDPARAAREIRRILRPGGVAIASVDSRCNGYDYYLESGDLDSLEEFHKSGKTEWLARDKRERFPTHAFLPGELTKLFERAGLEVVDLCGKTCLDARGHAELLEDPKAFRRLFNIELECRREPAFIGRAAHLEIVVKKPEK